MNERTDWIDRTKLDELNDTIYARGSVDREDILSFLTLIDTTDPLVIIAELKKWLSELNDSTKHDKVVFSQADINAVIGDLESYGVLQHATILELRENSSRNLL